MEEHQIRYKGYRLKFKTVDMHKTALEPELTPESKPQLNGQFSSKHISTVLILIPSVSSTSSPSPRLSSYISLNTSPSLTPVDQLNPNPKPEPERKPNTDPKPKPKPGCIAYKQTRPAS